MPTGKNDGALFVMTGLGSTMSVAEAALRNETTPETVFGTPVGVVAYTLRAAGTIRFGGFVSRTVTLKVAELVLGLESDAEQVTVVTFMGKRNPLAGMHKTGSAPLTESNALGAGTKFTIDPVGPLASVIRGPGRVRTGPVVSTTFTVNVAGWEVLFEASLAVQETMVEPIGNVAPDEWSQEMLGEGSTRSLALTVNGTEAPLGPAASFVIVPGTETEGAVVSTRVTVTENDALPMFVPSLAVHVTVVVPTLNFDPDAGRQPTVGDPATASLAEPAPYATA